MKIIGCIVSSSFVAMVALPARAQTQLDWSQTFVTPGNDRAMAVTADVPGNVFVAGSSNMNAFNQGGSAFVAAWSNAGAPLWNASWDSTLAHGESPSVIAVDGAGGVYVAGVALGAPSGIGFAAFLLRVDSTGTVAWSVQQPTTNTGARLFEIPMILDSQGLPVLASRSPAGDIEVTAYTAGGGVAWQTTYPNAAGIDTPVALALAPNGEIVVAGDVNSTSMTSPGQLVLLRISPAGALLHSVEISTAELPSALAADVAVDAQGNIFLAARGTPSGWLALHTMATLGFNPQGALQWVRQITGPAQLLGLGGARATNVEIDSFGRAIVLGGKSQGTGFGTAIVLVAYDAAGNELWRNVKNDAIGTAAVDLFNPISGLLIDPSGEMITVGSRSPAAEMPDLTQGDASVFSVDAGGATRFGLAYGFPAQADGSPDGAEAGVVLSGQKFVIVGRAHTAAGDLGNDAFVARFSRTASGYCFGDSASAACPCGNASAPVERSGCASSLGVGGRLADSGASSLAGDTLRLVGSSMPNSIAIYYQGTIAGAGTSFGDGLACVRGEIVRLGETVNVGGGSQFPSNGGPAISTQGQVNAPGTRVYQVVYRNAASFCTSKTFNTTNGMTVTWIP